MQRDWVRVGSDIAFVAEQRVFELDLDRERQRGPGFDLGEQQIQRHRAGRSCEFGRGFHPGIFVFEEEFARATLEFFPEAFAGDLIAFNEAGDPTGDFLRSFGQRFPVQRADHPFHATAYIFGAALQRLRFDDRHFLFTDRDMPTFRYAKQGNRSLLHCCVGHCANTAYSPFGVAIAEETPSTESATASATDTNSVLRMRFRIYFLPFEITGARPPTADGPVCVAATCPSCWSSSSVSFSG